LRRAQIPLARFEAVLLAFGGLPKTAQCELANQLIRASGIYTLRKSIKERGFPTREETRKRLKLICTSATRLLKLLGISDTKSVALGDLGSIALHPVTTTDILTGLYRVAIERRPQMPVDAWRRLVELLVVLSDLVEITDCAQAAPAEKEAKSKSAEGELIHTIIDAYAKFRDRFPESGPGPKFDASLRTFVRLCLEFVDPRLASQSRITDNAIRGLFNRWLAQIET
jgi:hypothetical protein